MLFTHLKHFINWVLPISCVLCGKVGIGSRPNICEPCSLELPTIPNPCGQCGLPLPTASLEGSLCGECLSHPPSYHLHALWSYQFPINQLILQLKFQHKLIYARLLGQHMANFSACYYTTGVPLPSILIPVPLHAKRLKERGFNQALEIAKPMSKRLNIPIHYTAVKRVKYTQAQMDLPLEERAQNIKAAFKVTTQELPTHVAVIDDVVTSGHTIATLCNELKKAGVKQIDVWCAARAIRF